MEHFRKNVGIVVFNKNKQVLVCARADKKNDAWQFPQGGINDGENFVDAAMRELREETALTSVKVVSTIDYGIKYRFPPSILQKMKHVGIFNVGQEQWWVLCYFYGKDSEINFYQYPEEVEFKDYQWVDIREAVARIVSFKKEIYQIVADTFEPVIKNFRDDEK